MQAFQQNHLEYKQNVYLFLQSRVCPMLAEREEAMVFVEAEMVLMHKAKLVV